MQVSVRKPSIAFRAIAPVIIAVLAAACLPVSAQIADRGNQTSASNPFYGSITLAPAIDQPIQLSLDDAIRRGLETNLGLKQAEYAEKAIHAQQLQALQQFLPTITATGDIGYYQHNLAA